MASKGKRIATGAETVRLRAKDAAESNARRGQKRANEFTEEELAFHRQATREFLPWLEAERSRAHPKDWPHLDEWIEQTKGEIAKPGEEAALESRPKAGAKR